MGPDIGPTHNQSIRIRLMTLNSIKNRFQSKLKIKEILPALPVKIDKIIMTFLTTLDAVSPKGDELLPFADGVGESVVAVDGPTRFTAALGDGSLNKVDDGQCDQLSELKAAKCSQKW